MVLIFVIDTAHGHSEKVLKTLSKIKKNYKQVPVCVGNIATGEAAKKLYNSGADIIKVGIGPGIYLHNKNGSGNWCSTNICNYGGKKSF